VSTPKRATLVGAIALLLATALIATAVLTGSLPGTQHVNTSKSGVGSLSIMLTDPPATPAGVTKVYVSYSNFGIHVSGAGNKSGWYPINTAGSIELLGTVNFSQTLGTVSVSTGVYNMIRFNLTSAKVTYNGANYTAFVPRSELIVPIVGGVHVNDSKLSATIIDLQTTIVNIGSKSNPEFIIRPLVWAFPVPPGQTSQSWEHKGFRLDLLRFALWKHYEERFTANLQVTTATLTANSLSVTVMNTGNHSTVLGLVTVAELSTFLGGHGMHPGLHIADGLMTSETFVVMKNGSLIPLRSLDKDVMQAMGINGKQGETRAYNSIFGQAGYNLTKGSSTTFSYSGQIVIGFSFFGLLPTSIVSGDSYAITVLGTQAVASTVVTAT